jgi:hypothetical protein
MQYQGAVLAKQLSSRLQPRPERIQILLETLPTIVECAPKGALRATVVAAMSFDEEMLSTREERRIEIHECRLAGVRARQRGENIDVVSLDEVRS